MQCLNPIWLQETSDRFGQYIPCNKCYNCLQKKRGIWTFRMMNENKDAETSFFVTLTYDDEHLPYVDQWNVSIASLYKPDLTNFFKKLRKTTKKKIRYFACGEYGRPDRTARPHYHIILWNYPLSEMDYDPIHKKITSEKIEKTWGKGLIDIGEVTQASCHYVAKYVLDPMISTWHPQDQRERPYATMSRRPGIGINYVTDEVQKYYLNNKNSYALVEGNKKQSLGRYYKEKIYGDFPNIHREMLRKAKNEAIKNQDINEKYIKSEAGKSDPEMHLQKIQREQRQYANRKINKSIKKQKL